MELKNGETYNGHLVNCDNWMNIQLREVICTSRVRLALMVEEEDGGEGEEGTDFLHSCEIKSASGLGTRLRVCITWNYPPPNLKV